MMHGRGKSSPVIVARKPANKADPETVSAAESMERRAGAEGRANQHARTGLRAGYAWSWWGSIRKAAMLDCQNPRREPYAGKLQVRVWAGGARQLASLPRRRREFITLLGGAVAWPLTADAQPSTMPIVGFLHSASFSTAAEQMSGVRKGLAESGYVVGQNLAIEYRLADGRYDRLPAL